MQFLEQKKDFEFIFKPTSYIKVYLKTNLLDFEVNPYTNSPMSSQKHKQKRKFGSGVLGFQKK